MGGGTREEEPRTPYIWSGQGNEAPTPEGGEGFREHEGVSQPLPGTLLRSRLAVVAQRTLGKARTAGRGGLAGRGWLRKGRSPQREPTCGLKGSPSQVLCNGSRTHQPLLLRPISMLSCSLWPPGQRYGGVRTHQCWESGQGDTGTHPPPCARQEAQTRGKW